MPCTETVLEAGTHVVVGGSAPEIGSERFAVFYHVGAVNAVFGHETGGAAELDVETGAGYNEVVALIVFDGGSCGRLVGRLHVGYGGKPGWSLREKNLLARYLASGREKAFGVLERIGYVEHPVGTGFNGGEGEGDARGLLWGHVEALHATRTDNRAVLHHVPVEIAVG